LFHCFARAFSHGERVRQLRIRFELGSRKGSRILRDGSVDALPFQSIRPVVVIVRQPSKTVCHSLARIVPISVALGVGDVCLVAKPVRATRCLANESPASERSVPIAPGSRDRYPLRLARPKVHHASAGVSIQRRSEEHTSELQSLRHLVCRLLLEKKKKKNK